jgi:hypothetical protein
MKKDILELFAEASDAVMKAQEVPEYAEKAKRIEEEILIQSSEYLGRLEEAQSRAIYENRDKLYKG